MEWTKKRKKKRRIQRWSSALMNLPPSCEKKKKNDNDNIKYEFFIMIILLSMIYMFIYVGEQIGMGLCSFLHDYSSSLF